MKKVSTAGAKPSKKISQQKLTVGLDLGDRNSWYCILDESGQIQLEQRVRSNAKALREVFGQLPHSRIALEVGTHSPWISRLLSELGHEVETVAPHPVIPTKVDSVPRRAKRRRSPSPSSSRPRIPYLPVYGSAMKPALVMTSCGLP